MGAAPASRPVVSLVGDRLVSVERAAHAPMRAAATLTGRSKPVPVGFDVSGAAGGTKSKSNTF